MVAQCGLHGLMEAAHHGNAVCGAGSESGNRPLTWHRQGVETNLLQ